MLITSESAAPKNLVLEMLEIQLGDTTEKLRNIESDDPNGENANDEDKTDPSESVLTSDDGPSMVI